MDAEKCVDVGTVTSPSAIRTAQDAMGRLDVLVCGQCHGVFHFIQEFQQHRNVDGACSKTSNFRESSNAEQKAKVWAFLLWKDTQMQQETERDGSPNSWKLYQQWCNMDNHMRDCWITAGKTIQTFTKISKTQMQRGNAQLPKTNWNAEESLVGHRTGQENMQKIKIAMKSPGKCSINDDSGDEYVVERVIAKRTNPKKPGFEYLLKWESYAPEHNTWEPAELVVNSCKKLVDEFEKNLANKKSVRDALHPNSNKTSPMKPVQIHPKAMTLDHSVTPESSSTGQLRRPMRSSKSKAMDQVKQWCGSMKDENNAFRKRRSNFSDSDSDEDGISTIKRSKGDLGSDEDWTAESEDEKIGRKNIFPRTFIRSNIQADNVNKCSISGHHCAGGVYVMHRKDGVIKLDSSPVSNKIMDNGNNGMLVTQNIDAMNPVRRQVMSSAHSMNPVKVTSKPDGTQVITQMKVVPKAVKSMASFSKKAESSKNDTPHQIHLLSSVPKCMTMQQTKSSGKTAQNSLEQHQISTSRTITDYRLISKTPTKSFLEGAHRISPQSRANQTSSKNVLTKNYSLTQNVQKRDLSGSEETHIPAPSFVIATSGPQITGVNNQCNIIRKNMNDTSQKLAAPKLANCITKYTNRLAQRGHIPIVNDKLLANSTIGTQNKTYLREEIDNRPKSLELISNDRGNDTKQKISTLVETLNEHQHSDDSSSEDEVPFPPISDESQIQGPESPHQFTLCPLTGRIIGEDGQPVEQTDLESVVVPEPTPTGLVQVIATESVSSNVTDTITSSPLNEQGELVLPCIETLSETTDGLIRVEMSPGGTTGLLVHSTETVTSNLSDVIASHAVISSAVDGLTCLESRKSDHTDISTVTVDPMTPITGQTEGKIEMDTVVEPVTSSSTSALGPLNDSQLISEDMTEIKDANMKLEGSSNLVTLTAEDGVVYQVAGHSENGQTLLLTQNSNGEQQCVYVTTDRATDDGAILTLDTAVAEAVALMPNHAEVTSQFYVKNGQEVPQSNPITMSVAPDDCITNIDAEDGESQAQVVAQVIQADEPTADGKRRVVLLLPDGNLMMTEVDEEQYASLELDK